MNTAEQVNSKSATGIELRLNLKPTIDGRDGLHFTLARAVEGPNPESFTMGGRVIINGQDTYIEVEPQEDWWLLSKLDSAGEPKWYARLYHEGKEKRFGPFKDKTEARNFYNKAKLDQLQGRFFPERYQGGGELIETLI